MVAKVILRFLLIALLALSTLFLSACGVKLDESAIEPFMEQLYKARKTGSFYKEFTLYAKDDFKIVPFEEVENTLRLVVGGSGRFKKARHIHTKISRRNQLGEGLISYVVATYEVTYSNTTLTESYFFLASEEKPKLVYMTLQF